MAKRDVEYQLSDRYHSRDGRVLLTGIQALARIPIDQLRQDAADGLNTAAFLSGYPGSPLGGLDQEISRALKLVPELRIVHQPAVNEELGATAVMGSQLAPGRPDSIYDGVVGFWYGKAPGLDRAGDALRHGVFAGSSSKGGAVVLVGDDPACKSSTMPSSSDATLVDLHMPVLYPGTVGECLELGLHAVAMSRASGLWSSMKIVTPIADGSGTVHLPALHATPILPTVQVGGVLWRSHPSAQFLGQRMVDVEREFREVRLPLAHRYGVENQLNRVTVNPGDAWIGLVSTGFTYYEMLDALRRLGLETEQAISDAGIRLLQLRMPVPFDAGLVRSFASGLEEILVVEEKNPTLEWLIKDALYGGPHQPVVLGKTHLDGTTLMPSWGRLDADTMLSGLRERLSQQLADRLIPEQPIRSASKLIPISVNRTPFFCSGCPHNWGTKVPEDAVVGAGTGCHGMSLLMEPDRVGEGIGITAMGNEGAQWIGMEPFVAGDHLFQNYGDGTFFHSGQLALQNCIGAGKHMTFKILFNGTVAMTGGQDSTFRMEIPELVTMLLAQGVAKVAITADDTDRYRGVILPAGVKVYDRTEIVSVQEDLRSTPGVTVLIHDQACAAELRRSRRRGELAIPTRRVVINHRICEGCGDCGDVSNCLSVQPVETALGRKTTIDQASCNFDESCLKGDCPAFMTVETSRSIVGNQPGRVAHVPSDVPDPVFDSETPMVSIRLAGIGGTGVVTVAQILSTAAMLDGWEVRGLDQTGLSQKAGPVISDVVLTRPGVDSSNLVGEGEADVVLAFDSLVAASDGAIVAAGGAATVVIASTRQTPTGKMISHPDLAYPVSEIVSRFEAMTSSEKNRFVDATALAEAFTGSPAQANILLLGIAVQEGRVPVSVQHLERAIDLNGVAVEANLAAFDWGRRWAHDSEAVEQQAKNRSSDPNAHLLTITVPKLGKFLESRISSIAGSGGLADLLKLLAADLVGYQNADYAEQFLDQIAETRAHEQGVAADSDQLTQAVARSLHKLMAYKDEYEVARLMLLPEARQAADAVGGEGSAITWRLHPPMLKSLGVDSKLSFGPRTKPMFRVLRRAKRFRGTSIDPFGRSEMRRTEQALPGEFLDSLRIVYRSLTAENLGEAVDIALLPDRIRGYEDLKMRRIGTFRQEMAGKLQLFVEP